MNVQWELPRDASVTISEAEKIRAIAQHQINADWDKGQFASPTPIITSGIVYAVFEAIRQIRLQSRDELDKSE